MGEERRSEGTIEEEDEGDEEGRAEAVSLPTKNHNKPRIKNKRISFPTGDFADFLLLKRLEEFRLARSCRRRRQRTKLSRVLHTYTTLPFIGWAKNYVPSAPGYMGECEGE